MTDAKHISTLTPEHVPSGLKAIASLSAMKRRKEAKPCYLYIMEAEGTGFCKVGISENPDKRARDIQGSNPHKVSVAFKTPLHGYDDNRRAAQEFEGMCHNALGMFKSKHAREWFEIPANAAEVLVGTVATAICIARGEGEPCRQ